jgi:hypothetical protein
MITVTFFISLNLFHRFLIRWLIGSGFEVQCQSGKPIPRNYGTQRITVGRRIPISQARLSRSATSRRHHEISKSFWLPFRI